jgi:uncharacterized RDD family membrane protein YckC
MQSAPPPTPQRYAGWWYRVAAYLTDVGIALLFAMVLTLVVAGDDADTQTTVFGVTAFVVWILVTSVAMAIFGGQTVGKRLTGTRVVIEDRPLGFGFSLLRDQLLRLLYFVPLFFLVDSLWAAFDKQSQTLRDKMVGTHVVDAGAAPVRGLAVGALGIALLAGWIALSVVLDREDSSRAQPGYTSLDRQTFVDSCQSEGAAEPYCTCLYDYIAERVPYDMFASVSSEDINQWPAPLREATRDGIERCS